MTDSERAALAFVLGGITALAVKTGEKLPPVFRVSVLLLLGSAGVEGYDSLVDVLCEREKA